MADQINTQVGRLENPFKNWYSSQMSISFPIFVLDREEGRKEGGRERGERELLPLKMQRPPTAVSLSMSFITIFL